MTRRRWIADEFSDHHAALLGQNAAHLARVLRARVGQEYDIVCGELVRLGTIDRSPKSAWSLPWARRCRRRCEREIVLVMAIYKFDRMEWAIEKCTELGVDADRSGDCAAHRCTPGGGGGQAGGALAAHCA